MWFETAGTAGDDGQFGSKDAFGGPQVPPPESLEAIPSNLFGGGGSGTPPKHRSPAGPSPVMVQVQEMPTDLFGGGGSREDDGFGTGFGRGPVPTSPAPSFDPPQNGHGFYGVTHPPPPLGANGNGDGDGGGYFGAAAGPPPVNGNGFYSAAAVAQSSSPRGDFDMFGGAPPPPPPPPFGQDAGRPSANDFFGVTTGGDDGGDWVLGMSSVTEAAAPSEQSQSRDQSRQGPNVPSENVDVYGGEGRFSAPPPHAHDDGAAAFYDQHMQHPVESVVMSVPAGGTDHGVDAAGHAAGVYGGDVNALEFSAPPQALDVPYDSQPAPPSQAAVVYGGDDMFGGPPQDDYFGGGGGGGGGGDGFGLQPLSTPPPQPILSQPPSPPLVPVVRPTSPAAVFSHSAAVNDSFDNDAEGGAHSIDEINVHPYTEEGDVPSASATGETEYRHEGAVGGEPLFEAPWDEGDEWAGDMLPASSAAPPLAPPPTTAAVDAGHHYQPAMEERVEYQYQDQQQQQQQQYHHQQYQYQQQQQGIGMHAQSEVHTVDELQPGAAMFGDEFAQSDFGGYGMGEAHSHPEDFTNPSQGTSKPNSPRVGVESAQFAASLPGNDARDGRSTSEARGLSPRHEFEQQDDWDKSAALWDGPSRSRPASPPPASSLMSLRSVSPPPIAHSAPPVPPTVVSSGFTPATSPTASAAALRSPLAATTVPVKPAVVVTRPQSPSVVSNILSQPSSPPPPPPPPPAAAAAAISKSPQASPTATASLKASPRSSSPPPPAAVARPQSPPGASSSPPQLRSPPAAAALWSRPTAPTSPSITSSPPSITSSPPLSPPLQPAAATRARSQSPPALPNTNRSPSPSPLASTFMSLPVPPQGRTPPPPSPPGPTASTPITAPPPRPPSPAASPSPLVVPPPPPAAAAAQNLYKDPRSLSGVTEPSALPNGSHVELERSEGQRQTSDMFMHPGGLNGGAPSGKNVATGDLGHHSSGSIPLSTSPMVRRGGFKQKEEVLNTADLFDGGGGEGGGSSSSEFGVPAPVDRGVDDGTFQEPVDDSCFSPKGPGYSVPARGKNASHPSQAPSLPTPWGVSVPAAARAPAGAAAAAQLAAKVAVVPSPRKGSNASFAGLGGLPVPGGNYVPQAPASSSGATHNDWMKQAEARAEKERLQVTAPASYSPRSNSASFVGLGGLPVPGGNYLPPAPGTPPSSALQAVSSPSSSFTLGAAAATSDAATPPRRRTFMEFEDVDIDSDAAVDETPIDMAIGIGCAAAAASMTGRRQGWRPPCAVTSFGFGGKLLVMIPRKKVNLRFPQGARPEMNAHADDVLRKGPVQVWALKDVVDPNAFVRDADTFPGPVDSFREKKLCQYVESKAFPANHAECGGAELLWSMVHLSMRFKGKLISENGVSVPDSPESAIVNALKRSQSGAYGRDSGTRLSTAAGASSAAPAMSEKANPREAYSRSTSDSAAVAGLSRIEGLLIDGKRKEAAEVAMAEKMWGLAMILACNQTPSSTSLGDDGFYQRVVRAYADEHLVCGSALHTITMAFSNQLSTSATRYGRNGDGDSNVTWSEKSWRTTAASMISNKPPNWQQQLVELGDRLKTETGDFQSAHALYLMAGLRIERPSLSARIVLPGVDHAVLQHRALCTPLASDAVHMLEALDLSRGATGDSIVAGHKLRLAILLADLGYLAKADAYVKSIQHQVNAMRASSGKSPYTEKFVSALSVFEDRVCLSYGSQPFYHSNTTVRGKDEAPTSGGKGRWLLGKVKDIVAAAAVPELALSPKAASVVSAPARTAPLPMPSPVPAQPQMDSMVTAPYAPVPLCEPASNIVVPEAPQQPDKYDDGFGLTQPPPPPQQQQPPAPTFFSVSAGLGSSSSKLVDDIPVSDSGVSYRPHHHHVNSAPSSTKPITQQAPPMPAVAVPEAPKSESSRPSSKPSSQRESKDSNSGGSQGGGPSFLKRMLTRVMHPEAKHADVGDSMAAYYDEKQKRWIFPGSEEEDTSASNPPPPPTMMGPGPGQGLGLGPGATLAPTDRASTGPPAAGHESTMASDPLAALMAPPSMARRISTGSYPANFLGAAGAFPPASTEGGPPRAKQGQPPPIPRYATFAPPKP